MKPGVNPVWKIVSNNMHVFVIDFLLVQYEGHMHAKTPYSKQLAICGW